MGLTYADLAVENNPSATASIAPMNNLRTPSAVRFSDEERALIHKAAKHAGLPFTSYVRMVALAAAKDTQKSAKSGRNP